ncbi:AAA family ATPase [Bradyrhizobium sp. CB82]|uniref:AAA family ATPase n=1 Tax=Bradyrhizobium sp. CB82 TaxID=3039159 RepID=UPI0024B18603|nr:AAA family ATPase [Bradyrhizobium sp. CB82]WFU44198.1 AAA family ATPase [Bradyrhizobium sp. CB82]
MSDTEDDDDCPWDENFEPLPDAEAPSIEPADVDLDVDLGDGQHEKPHKPLQLDLAPYAFPDPASIPPRQWLYGRHYIRGVVGASIGAPGRAKSTAVLTEIISMAVGRDLMSGETLPSGPLRAAYLNGEETQDELDRRVAAICQRFGITPSDCHDRLWVISTRNRSIRIAVSDDRGNAVVAQKVVDTLRSLCDDNMIDVLAVDPLISFHRIRESSNEAMDLVVKEAFGHIAGASRSVELVHHTRKLGPGESISTVDDARGASAILGAVRSARTFNFMTPPEAAKLGISDDERRRHIKIENGKSNQGPIGAAHWIKIEVEKLPNGDDVACSTLWIPPNPFDGVSVSDIEVVQKVVQGGAFRADSQSPEWLGWWMAENLPHLNIKTRHSDKPRDKAEVARLNSILKIWEKNKVIAIEPRKDEKRRERRFYIVGEAIKVETATLEDAAYDDS